MPVQGTPLPDVRDGVFEQTSGRSWTCVTVRDELGDTRGLHRIYNRHDTEAEVRGIPVVFAKKG